MYNDNFITLSRDGKEELVNIHAIARVVPREVPNVVTHYEKDDVFHENPIKETVSVKHSIAVEFVGSEGFAEYDETIESFYNKVGIGYFK